MPIYKSNQPIEVIRKTNTKGLEIMVGDQIHVSKYTATCQKITQAGALFLLDQYLDQAYPMNAEDSNRGGYEASDLRKTLQSEEVLKIFAEYRDRMQPFDNGDLLRIPFFGEIFGKEDANYFEPDDCEPVAAHEGPEKPDRLPGQLLGMGMAPEQEERVGVVLLRRQRPWPCLLLERLELLRRPPAFLIV